MVKKRTIRTFIKRYRNMTSHQEEIFKKYWRFYGINFSVNNEFVFDFCFNKNNPIVLDIGFGCGDGLIEQAIHNPDFRKKR